MPSITTAIDGSSITSTAGNIGLASLYNLDTSGNSTGRGTSAAAFAGSGGSFAGSGADATTESSPRLEARVNGSATLAAAGNVSLRSQSDNRQTAAAKGQSGGVVGVGASIAKATANGTNTARLDGRVEAHPAAGVVDSTKAGATNVRVRAIGSDRAAAIAEAVVGGVLAIDVNKSTADVTPTVTAAIGKDALVNVATNLDVIAIENPEADARTTGVSGAPFRSAFQTRTSPSVRR